MSNQTTISFPSHENSLDAWYNIVSPTLNNRQKVVLSAIKTLGKATLNDLELFLHKSKNCFSGRVTELKKKELIKQVGRVKIGESSFSVYEVNTDKCG